MYFYFLKQRSQDLSGLLLLYSSSGNKAGMQQLATQAKEAGRLNVAFIAYFLTGQVESAIQLLIDGNRIPEAAFLARTYLPSQISRSTTFFISLTVSLTFSPFPQCRVLDLWKADLKQINEKAAEALADPAKYPNLFPDLDLALKVFLSLPTSIVR